MEPSDSAVETLITQAATGRPPNACYRCKRKKSRASGFAQRRGHELTRQCSYDKPACQSCTKAGVECEYPSNIIDGPTWSHVKALEARVKALEEKLQDEKHAEGARKRRRLSNDGPSPGQLGILPTLDESPFVRPSWSQLLNRLPTSADISGLLQDAERRDPAMKVEVDRSLLPSRDKVDLLVTHFLDFNNAGYPIIHGPTLRRQVDAICSGKEQTTAQDVFIVFMVLAIAGTSQARGQPLSSTLTRQAHEFWRYAQQYLPHCTTYTNLGKLQAILLTVYYTMHHPGAGNLWDLSGQASRVAIDLGLHQESDPPAHCNPLEQDMRRRLFWTAYCIDRNMSATLGRPPSIPHDWMNVQSPSLVPDEHISPSGITSTTPDWRKETFMIHIRLRILQSDIHQRLYTVTASKTPCPTQEWYQEMETRIQKWSNDAAVSGSSFLPKDWIDVTAHITRTWLYRPSPGNPEPTHQALAQAITSSGHTMRLYKEMWRKKSVNFVWLSIHHVFMAGVTYLNSIYVASKYQWNIVPSLVESMLDIQACASVLEAMTAHEPDATGVRDAFETVCAAVVRKLSDISTTPPSITPDPLADTFASFTNDADLGIFDLSTFDFLQPMTMPALQSGPSGTDRTLSFGY